MLLKLCKKNITENKAMNTNLVLGLFLVCIYPNLLSSGAIKTGVYDIDDYH